MEQSESGKDRLIGSPQDARSVTLLIVSREIDDFGRIFLVNMKKIMSADAPDASSCLNRYVNTSPMLPVQSGIKIRAD